MNGQAKSSREGERGRKGGEERERKGEGGRERGKEMGKGRKGGREKEKGPRGRERDRQTDQTETGRWITWQSCEHTSTVHITRLYGSVLCPQRIFQLRFPRNPTWFFSQIYTLRTFISYFLFLLGISL